MQFTSPAFEEKAKIPEKYTFGGANVSPPLRIGDVPDGARSLVILAEDIDSPIGVFTHWVVWNISPDTTEIPEGATPQGAQIGCNGFGDTRYAGPCPPSGHHRYRFRLLALDKELDATTPDRKDQIASEMKGHVIAEAALTGSYQAKP